MEQYRETKNRSLQICPIIDKEAKAIQWGKGCLSNSDGKIGHPYTGKNMNLNVNITPYN